MDVEIKIDEVYCIPKIVIHTKEVTSEISELVNRLCSDSSKTITGFKNESIYLINPEDIINIYTEDQKIYACCTKGIFQLKSRLYELENILLGTSFLRISNSEIVNFKKVESLDMSMSGTISLKFITGSKSFVSRRYVEKIKKYLGL